MKIQKIKAAIIGSGFGERVMLPCLTATEKIDVVAFVSRSPKKIETSVKQYNVEHVVLTVDELLDIKEVELVCIVTPPFLHHETVKKIAGEEKLYLPLKNPRLSTYPDKTKNNQTITRPGILIATPNINFGGLI